MTFGNIKSIKQLPSISSRQSSTTYYHYLSKILRFYNLIIDEKKKTKRKYQCNYPNNISAV